MSVVLNSRLGVSAVSVHVVDAVTGYAERNRVPLMIIASRNQVEHEALGRGYCGLSASELVARVRSRSPAYTFLCRDHGGPYFSDDDATLEARSAADRARQSLLRDVEAGFDLVHIDWSRSGADVVAETRSRIDELRACAAPRKVAFEVSISETNGVADRPESFARTFGRFRDASDVMEFAAANTGSLVRERYQVGFFEFAATGEMTRIAHELGMRFKEHNADYLGYADLRMRALAGVDAVNIGPELGVLETEVLVRLAAVHGAAAELEALFERAVASGKWRKWAYASSPSPRTKALVATHYCHGTFEYAALVDRLQRRVDVDAAVGSALSARIDDYVRCLPATVGEAGGARVARRPNVANSRAARSQRSSATAG